MGKHRPTYTPHVDTGDYVVVVNAEKVAVTGNKLKDKMYHHHTGYVGNLKSISLEKQLEKAPERVLQSAVKGMLPRNPLGRAMMTGDLHVRFLHPVPAGSLIHLSAQAENDGGPLRTIRAEVCLDEQVMARAVGRFVDKSLANLPPGNT